MLSFQPDQEDILENAAVLHKCATACLDQCISVPIHRPAINNNENTPIICPENIKIGLRLEAATSSRFLHADNQINPLSRS